MTKTAIKLTDRQLTTLKALKAGPRPAYPYLWLGTLNSLSLRKLVKAEHLVGSITNPHNSIMWSLTKRGEKVLAYIENNA